MVSNVPYPAFHDSNSESESSHGENHGDGDVNNGIEPLNSKARNMKKTKKIVDDSPEAEVQIENKAIAWVRLLALLVLLLAASITVAFVYIYTSKSEHDKFVSEYDAVATLMVKSLLLDMRLSFFTARTLASAVTLALETTGKPVTNLTISSSRWNGLAQEALVVTDAAMASWIPFLYTDDERRIFEEYIRENDSEEAVISYPPCHLCGGNPDLVFENEEQKVDVPGSGVYACGELYAYSRGGGIPPNSCPFLIDVVKPYCRCVKSGSSGAELDSPNQTSSAETSDIIPWTKSNGLFRFLDDDEVTVAVGQEYGTAPYAPMYSISVVAEDQRLPVLYNQLSDPFRAKTLDALMFVRTPAVSEMRLRSHAYDRYTRDSAVGEPTSDLYFPVFDPNSTDPKLVGAIALEVRWPEILSGGVPVNSDLLTVVIRSTCGQVFTYSINKVERSLQFQGEGDLHDPKYDSWVRSTAYDEFAHLIGLVSSGIPISNATDPGQCLYLFEAYPTQAMEDSYITKEPALFAVVSVVIFLFTSFVFIAYDAIVRRRQVKVMASANRTNDIVSSLFPESIRQRMYKQANLSDVSPDSMFWRRAMPHDGDVGIEQNASNVFGTEPIADLFPHSTVMFIDIADFTAWSSEREPSQVFTLLENLYNVFDEVGRNLGIFKVETVGDSYVAVAGLPTPRKDHAVGKKIMGLYLLSLACFAFAH
jgi:hypothetical protein